jgi:hypothetical protein
VSSTQTAVNCGTGLDLTRRLAHGVSGQDCTGQRDSVAATERFRPLTINTALALAREAAQGATNAATQSPLWLEIIQTAAAVATTVGVLIALYLAVVREPRKAAEERRRHQVQMDALNRAEMERVAAQARKVVPSCVRTPMFGDSWWTVKVENASNAVTTILAVDVTALDANGSEVLGGCQQANNTMPIDQAFERSIQAALSGSLQGGFQRSGYGSMIPQGAAQQLSSQLAPRVKQVMQEAMVGHFAKEWQSVLGPNQHALMGYTTANPDYKLRITIDFEDEAGYQWRRIDSSQPEPIDPIEPKPDTKPKLTRWQWFRRRSKA